MLLVRTKSIRHCLVPLFNISVIAIMSCYSYLERCGICFVEYSIIVVLDAGEVLSERGVEALQAASELLQDCERAHVGSVARVA